MWGRSGDDGVTFSSPNAIAIDSLDKVYVAESGNSRVQKFNSDGEWLATFGANGRGPGEFLSAMVVIVDAQDRVYVSDWGNQRIPVFDSAGAYHDTLGFPEDSAAQELNPQGANTGRKGEGQLFNPTGVGIDGEGNVFVVDRGNHRVQVFSPLGEFVQKFDRPGTGPGQFQVPTSIAFDSQGNFYVSEVANHRIQRFSPSGEFLGEVAPGTLSNPHGLAFDSTGAFYVADTGNRVVRKYRVVDAE